MEENHNLKALASAILKLRRQHAQLESAIQRQILGDRAADIRSGKKKRGPQPKQRERVIAAMTLYDRSALITLTEEAMSSEFAASRDVCRKARKCVLDGSDETVTIDN